MKGIQNKQTKRQLTPIVDPDRCLSNTQLHDLENTFRTWAEKDVRPKLQSSRQRILLIFLIIRYTGARLNEVLQLNPAEDFQPETHAIRFSRNNDDGQTHCRDVRLPEAVFTDLQKLFAGLLVNWTSELMLRIDPAHVRRKFYEQAEAVGIPRSIGSPEAIRKARAVELLEHNMPLPVVQKILGHSTPNLTAAYVDFSESEISRVAQYFAERESKRKTSARNTFFGKICSIAQGDLQSIVKILTVSRNVVTSVITTDSLRRIGLQQGMFITAEIKAPCVQLSKEKNCPACSAENIFQGRVRRIANNQIAAEVVVVLPDNTEICAIITETMRRQLDLMQEDTLWVFFDAFSVILHSD